MIQKLWQTIAIWLGFQNKSKPTIIKRAQKKQRFLVIQDPFDQKFQSTNQINDKTKKQITVPKNSQQLMHFYSLHYKQEQDVEQIIQAKQNNDFCFDLSEMNEVIKQIQRKQNELMNTSDQIATDIGSMLNKIARINQSQQKQKISYRKYVKIVQDVIDIKYAGERIDYPLINFQKFKQIDRIWNLHQRQGQHLIQGYDHLRYNHLRLLGPTRWLNDQVISQYINLMNLKISENSQNNYVIFNSLKVTSLFDKTDYQKLQKVLQRQRVSKKTTLILAVHKRNHWIFIKMQNSQIEIYDSLVCKTIAQYINFPIIGKIIKFAQYFYGSATDVKKITNFPQQKNGYDCGLMMLCGIKDIVRDYRNWSFCQNDILYKRALITSELHDKRITGFK